MTDPDQAARLAAIRAKRGQSPVATTSTASTPAASTPVASTARISAPRAKKAHPHIAAGARIVVTGLTASGIFGLTTVIAAANQPKAPAAATDPSATTSTTLYADSSLGSTVPGTNQVTGTVLSPSGQTVVLTIPAVGSGTTVAHGTPTTTRAGQPAQQTAGTQAPATAAPGSPVATPAPTQATPAPTPAPTPPPTTATPTLSLIHI